MIDINNLKNNDLIKHIKTNEIYNYKNLVLIQIKQEWITGVRYTNRFNQEFIRRIEDFEKSFIKI